MAGTGCRLPPLVIANQQPGLRLYPTRWLANRRSRCGGHPCGRLAAMDRSFRYQSRTSGVPATDDRRKSHGPETASPIGSAIGPTRSTVRGRAAGTMMPSTSRMRSSMAGSGSSGTTAARAGSSRSAWPSTKAKTWAPELPSRIGRCPGLPSSCRGRLTAGEEERMSVDAEAPTDQDWQGPAGAPCSGVVGVQANW
jgi:hypothetical protein